MIYCSLLQLAQQSITRPARHGADCKIVGFRVQLAVLLVVINTQPAQLFTTQRVPTESRIPNRIDTLPMPKRPDGYIQAKLKIPNTREKIIAGHVAANQSNCRSAVRRKNPQSVTGAAIPDTRCRALRALYCSRSPARQNE